MRPLQHITVYPFKCLENGDFVAQGWFKYPLRQHLGAPEPLRQWNLRIMKFLSRSTAYVPNFSLLAPKMWILWFKGGFRTPGGCTQELHQGAMSPFGMGSLQHIVYPFKCLHTKFYLQKYGVYGLGAFQYPQGLPLRGPEPLRCGISPAYKS